MLRATPTSPSAPLVPGETFTRQKMGTPSALQTGSDRAQFAKRGTRGVCRALRAEAQQCLSVSSMFFQHAETAQSQGPSAIHV